MASTSSDTASSPPTATRLQGATRFFVGPVPASALSPVGVADAAVDAGACRHRRRGAGALALSPVAVLSFVVARAAIRTGVTTVAPPGAGEDTWTTRRIVRLGGTAAAIGVAVMALCLWSGDGRPQASIGGLPDAGQATAWAVPVTRVLTNLAGVMTVGLLVVAAFLAPAREDALVGSGLRWARAARWTAAGWALLVLVHGVFCCRRSSPSRSRRRWILSS